jgi:hypothetical protein
MGSAVYPGLGVTNVMVGISAPWLLFINDLDAVSIGMFSAIEIMSFWLYDRLGERRCPHRF